MTATENTLPSIYAPRAIEPVVEMVKSFLSGSLARGERFNVNETIQVSWIWLKVAAQGTGTKITAPRFHANPMEFIDDCSDSLNLIAQQRYLADSVRTEYGWCHCRQSAVIARDLWSCDEWFMNRTDSESGNASGWFIGSMNTSLDVNDPDNFETISLWELFCRQPRLGDFFLLPQGWQVVVRNQPVIMRDHKPVEPAKGSFYELKYLNRFGN